MKRIQTKSDIEKKKKTNSLILSLFMLLILIVSSVGFAFMSRPDDAPSTDQGINNPGFNRISFNYQGKIISLLSSYDEVDNVNSSITMSLNSYLNQPLYIDSLNQGIFQEIESNLGQFASRVQQACYGSCDKNLPEKDCSANLIVWSESQTNKVSQLEKCIFIEGDMRAVDAFIYKLFGSPAQ